MGLPDLTSVQAWMWLAALCVLPLTLLAAWLARRRPLHPRAWIISLTFSLGCVLATGIIWRLVDGAPFSMNVCNPVMSAERVSRFEAYYRKSFTETHKTPPIFIRTGIFIETVEFVNANDAVVSGFVWQKLPADFPADARPGVIFPEAVNESFTEGYRTLQDGRTLVGWAFTATVRQQYFFDAYPLDWQDLWIRMWPAEMVYNVVLQPDLDSYASLDPADLPGLESWFVLENWNLRGTYFTMCSNDNKTSFGLSRRLDNRVYEELNFDINFSRNMLNGLLTFAGPPIISLILVFSILIISTSRTDKNALSGWNIANALAFCASLLLVIVFAQINMRQALDAPGVIYLEYFYFIVYFAILLVSVDSILFNYTDRFGFIEYEDNLLPKTIFWPLITGAFLLITLWTFAIPMATG